MECLTCHEVWTLSCKDSQIWGLLKFLKLQIFKLHQRRIRPSPSSPRNCTLVTVILVTFNSCAVVPSEEPARGCWAYAELQVETANRETSQGLLPAVHGEKRNRSEPKPVRSKGRLSKSSEFKLTFRLMGALTRTGNGGRELRPVLDYVTAATAHPKWSHLVSSSVPSLELRRALGWNHH